MHPQLAAAQNDLDNAWITAEDAFNTLNALNALAFDPATVARAAARSEEARAALFDAAKRIALLRSLINTGI
jgi:hypothetical protein